MCVAVSLTVTVPYMVSSFCVWDHFGTLGANPPANNSAAVLRGEGLYKQVATRLTLCCPVCMKSCRFVCPWDTRTHTHTHSHKIRQPSRRVVCPCIFGIWDATVLQTPHLLSSSLACSTTAALSLSREDGLT